MSKYKVMLRILAKPNNIGRIDKSTDLDFNVAQQLFDRGLIDAELDKTYGGPGFINPRITLAGQEWLEDQGTKEQRSIGGKASLRV